MADGCNEVVVHPILQICPDARNSPELDFATSVVDYIMGYDFPKWHHPLLRRNGSLQFKPSIRMVMRYMRLKYMDSYRRHFNETFTTNEIKAEQYLHFGRNRTFSFINEPYDHFRFLMFCGDISMYSVFMYQAGHLESPDYAVLRIMYAIWPLRFCWYQDVDFNAHWKHLGEYCKSIKAGELVHPILEYYPDAENTPQFHFAIDVVNYIVRIYFPNWQHLLRSKIESDWFTPAIRRAIDALRLKYSERYRRDINEYFNNDEMKTSANFVSFIKSVTVRFKNDLYEHDKFLEFCTQVSMYSVLLYGENHPDSFDFAVLSILLGVWPSILIGDKVPIPFGLRLKRLDQNCRRLEGTIPVIAL